MDLWTRSKFYHLFIHGAVLGLLVAMQMSFII